MTETQGRMETLVRPVKLVLTDRTEIEETWVHLDPLGIKETME